MRSLSYTRYVVEPYIKLFLARLIVSCLMIIDGILGVLMITITIQMDSPNMTHHIHYWAYYRLLHADWFGTNLGSD